MEPLKEPICENCKHRPDDLMIGCNAFKDGIPEIIIITNKHDKPLEDQDNDLVYEPRVKDWKPERV